MAPNITGTAAEELRFLEDTFVSKGLNINHTNLKTKQIFFTESLFKVSKMGVPKETAPFLENLIIAQLKEIAVSTGTAGPSLLTAASQKPGHSLPVLLESFI